MPYCTCARCMGHGPDEELEREACRQCDGAKTVSCDDPEFPDAVETCPHCHGTGDEPLPEPDYYGMTRLPRRVARY